MIINGLVCSQSFALSILSNPFLHHFRFFFLSFFFCWGDCTRSDSYRYLPLLFYCRSFCLDLFGFPIVLISITTCGCFPWPTRLSYLLSLTTRISLMNLKPFPYTTTTPLLPQYYEAPPALVDILAYMNLIFTMLFSLECILKLAAFGIKVHSYYLRR